MSPRDARRGSVALEAALAVSGFLLVSVLMLYGVLSVVAGIRVDAALERTGRIVSLASVAADFTGVDRLEEFLKEAGIGPDSLGISFLEDGLVSGLGTAVLPSLFDASYVAAGPSVPVVDRLYEGTGPGRWTVAFEARLSEGWMRVEVQYGLRTPFGTVVRRRAQGFALWNDGDGTRDARESSNVWDLGNLERGRALRVRFGGNLPLGYPVIASFRSGVATAIHSMDLSPFGWQDAIGAEEELAGWIRDLAGFDGTASPWGMDGVDVPPGATNARRLLLVVPTNTDDGRFASILATAEADASLQGVVLSVVRYQERKEPVAVE